MKHVYIFDMDNELVKIGVSNNVRARMSTITNSSGFAVIRHHETEPMDDGNAYALESSLHRHFAAQRARGEYFKITFEEACAELNRRKPTAAHIFSPWEDHTDTVRQFVEIFCTTDKSAGGICGGGVAEESFYEELYRWACAKYGFFKYDELRGINLLPHLQKIFDKRVYQDRFSPFGNIGGKVKYFYAGIYWKEGTPQELALQERVQRVRNVFTGLWQQKQDELIGGFITDYLKAASLEIFANGEAVFGEYTYSSISKYISGRLSELCGEPFLVYAAEGHLRYSSYREICAKAVPQELDDAAVGIYCGNLLQIIQRYCPAELFFKDAEWHVRYLK